MNFEQMQRGYRNLWSKAVIRPERRDDAQRIADKLRANRDRYERVAASFPGMPWWFVAIAHQMEANANFNRYLGNGQPLAQVTTIVPKGRGPFRSFEAGAIDALELKKLQHVKEWSLERCLYELERFNGFGYISKGINSPYIWSFTNLYSRGKYVRDHVYDPNAVSSQCGAAAIMKALGVEAEQPKKEEPMSELASTIQPFGSFAPTLVRVIAGPAATFAVRALADALGQPSSDPKEVKEKLDAQPLDGIINAVRKAEESLNVLMPAQEPVAGPVKAEEPTAAPVPPTPAPSVQPVPVTPAPGKIDNAFGAWLTGWKTYAGIAGYVLASIAGIAGYIPAEMVEALQVFFGGLAGVGIVAKLERYLSWAAILIPSRKVIVPQVRDQETRPSFTS